MSQPLALSPTQIERFLLCNRAWGYERLDKIEEQKSKQQKEILSFGTKTHSLIENYFRHLTVIPHDTKEGACALAGLHHWPHPGPSVIAEGAFSYDPFGEGFLWRGIQDLLYPDSPDEFCLVVHDHKTCSSFDYQKTPEDLLLDPQAVIYSHRWFLRGIPRVRLKWVYHRRSKPKAEPTSLVVTAADMARGLALCRAASHEILRAHRGKSSALPRAHDAPDGWKACAKFRGCGHMAHCLSKGEIFHTFYQASQSNNIEENES